MNKIIAYCGLDCAACEGYQATQTNDMEWLEATVAKWRIEYQNPAMPVSAAICDGCTSQGRLGGYCLQCPTRACATSRGLSTCAECPDYACERLESFLKAVPEARANLEALRS